MKLLTLATLCLMVSPAIAAEIEKEFEGLGGNRVLLEKAKAFNPGQEVTIVQERLVPRRNRVELAPEFSGTFGGDTYTNTQAIALNVHYHITPRWSVGLRYGHNFNQLSEEGKATARRAQEDYLKDRANPTAAVPTVDYPKSETFATLYWYPIYGKMNLLDRGVAHFDFYALGGYGQVNLSSGNTPSYTAGGGFGFWWTKHFSSRIEMRYQNYTAKYFEESTKMDLAIASLQLGWLL